MKTNHFRFYRNPIFSENIALSIIFVVLTGFFAFYYSSDPSCPDLCKADPLGWYQWWDQSQYYKMAQELTQFKLNNPQYWIGYPILGSLFIKILPHHPFLIPNYLLMLLMAFCFFSVVKNYIERWEAILLSIGAFVWEQSFWTRCIIWPWNSIVIFTTIFYCIYYFSTKQKRLLHEVLKYLLTVLSLLARPSDGLLIFIFWFLLGWSESSNNLIKYLFNQKLFILTGLAAILSNLICNIFVFGTFFNPYMKLVSENIGFSLQNFTLKLYQWLFDPQIINPVSTFLPPGLQSAGGVVKRAPYVIFAIPGLFLLASKNLIKTLLFSFFTCFFFLLYLGFNPTSYPPHHWAYHGYRYYWWFIPWAMFLAYLFFRQGWKKNNLKPCGLGLLLLPGLYLFTSYQNKTVDLFYEINPVIKNQKLPDTLQKKNPTCENKEFNIFINNTYNEKIFGIYLLASNNVLPFHLSAASKANITKIELQNKKMTNWKNFFAVGEPGLVCISFINNPITNQLVKLNITFDDISNANVEKVKTVLLRKSF